MEGPSPPQALRAVEIGNSVPRSEVRTFINSLGRGSAMTIIATGIDLAKNVFAVHGVSLGGTVELRQPKVGRAKLGALIAALPPTVIGMEACSGAHHWARQFQAYGHTVRLMAPKLVTPYRMTGKRGKNDAADAAAICYVSPAVRHDGHDVAILAARHALYQEARERNPARWSGSTRDWSPVGAVTLNPERDAVVAEHLKNEDRQPLAV